MPPLPPASPRTRSVDRFRLTGPSPALDLRIDAVRRDLADAAVADRVFAPHYARSAPRTASKLIAMRAEPDENASAVSELAIGEGFSLLDESGGWAWGYSDHDHYVGYVPAGALVCAAAPPTHVVSAPAALVFAAADIKSPVVRRLPLGSRVAVSDGDDTFRATGDGFIHERHLRALTAPVGDPVAVAESLVGTPYRWGGRGGDGIDCSGLVQRCLGLADIPCPRDSDQQRALGRAVQPEDGLRRGDLVFLPGHVGMMVDAERVVHANAFWMAVTVEALAAVLARAGNAAPEYRRL